MMRTMTSILSGVAAVLLAAGGMNAYANTGDDDGSSLKLSLTPSTRYFVRLGGGVLKPDDKASDVKDLSGPVVPYDATNYVLNNSVPFSGAWLGAFGVKNSIDIDKAAGDYTNAAGIGVPPGLSQKAKGVGWTLFVSLGTYLDDDKKWSAETFVLGVPIKLKAVGAGNLAAGTQITYKDNGGATHTATIDLGTVGTTKLLPMSAIFNYNFFNKDSKWRPTLGVMLTYNIFFETQASDSLSAFNGGPTKIKFKNAPGFGPILGIDYRLDDRWSLNARFTYQFVKTTGTLTTRTNTTTLWQSPVQLLVEGKQTGPTVQAFYQDPTRALPFYRAVAQHMTGDPNYMGTFSRKFDYRANAMAVLVSLTYDF